MTTARQKDENFQRTVALYNDLKPKQVKELLMPLDTGLVADYFRAFDSERSTKIIAEFKTPEERLPTSPAFWKKFAPPARPLLILLRSHQPRNPRPMSRRRNNTSCT